MCVLVSVRVDFGPYQVTEINLAHKMDTDHLEGEKGTIDSKVTVAASPVSQEAPHSFTKNLMPYSGYVNHIFFFNAVSRPIMMLACPAVL